MKHIKRLYCRLFGHGEIVGLVEIWKTYTISHKRWARRATRSYRRKRVLECQRCGGKVKDVF